MRPMRHFGEILKGLFNPPKTGIFWIKVPQNFKTKEDKNNFIYSTLELLNIKISVNDNQDSEH